MLILSLLYCSENIFEINPKLLYSRDSSAHENTKGLKQIILQ